MSRERIAPSLIARESTLFGANRSPIAGALATTVSANAKPARTNKPLFI